MNDTPKTLVIKTMSERKYAELSAAGQISDKQLNIVDDDNSGRTVIASYGILLKKIQLGELSLSYDTIDGIKYIRLVDKDGNERSRIDATDFLKDGVLNGIEYVTDDENNGGLQFTIKKDDSESIKRTIFVDSQLLSGSANAVQNKVVYGGISSALVQANSYTDSEIENLSVDAIYQKKTDSETSAAALDARIANIESDYLTATDKTELLDGISQKASLTALAEIAGCLSVYSELMASAAVSSSNEYSDEISNAIRSDLDDLSGTVVTIYSDYALGSDVSSKSELSQKFDSVYSDMSSVASNYAVSCVGGLSVNDIDGSASKTVSKITESGGIVSAEFTDISISQNQVDGLTTALENINNKFSEYYVSSQTSSKTELADEFKKYQLSGDYLSTVIFQETSADHESRILDLENSLPRYAELSGDNVFTGDNTFTKDLNLSSNINVGDRIANVGDNTVAIGNDLSIGSYNFFWKGIDVNTDTSCALIYLTDKQPRYPYPFVITNGNKQTFKIFGKTVSIEDRATYNNLSASDARYAYNCNVSEPWRQDYNQLCTDYAAVDPDGNGKNYRSDLTWVTSKLQEYIDDAFSADANAAIYINGHENKLIGQQITMVNNDKIEYRRCGKVLGIIDGSVLSVNVGSAYNDGKAYAHLTANGVKFKDFDYDDDSLVFIDYPFLSGPSNVSQYSSINVGVKNKVLRRCSGAFGKENTSESDFAFAIGRKAHALHYSTFVWAPATHISSVSPYTFNIGLNAPMISAYQQPNFDKDITIIDKNNKSERLYKYVWNCMSCDPGIQAKQITPLKTAVQSIWSALSTYTVKDGQIKTADQLSVDDVMNAFHDLATNLSTLWQSMN